MLEFIINILKDVPWQWAIAIAFLTTLVENLFPPAPGDSVLVFMGTLVGINVVGFFPLLAAATLGSTIGFTFMFYLGHNYGKKIYNSRYSKYFPIEALVKAEKWFAKYGYTIIFVNRFLTGTRAVISFFAGMSELKYIKTIILSLISATIWNFILIYLGKLFGNNWKLLNEYLNLYGRIMYILLGLIALGFAIRFAYIKIRHKKAVKEEKLMHGIDDKSGTKDKNDDEIDLP